MDFLKEISTYDIDLLLKDIELMKVGYEINYVIDASDVISYAFPYGIKFDMLDRFSPDDIGDKMIAYEFILQNYNPIILNEYKLELILIRNRIRTNFDQRLDSNLFTNTIENHYQGKHLANKIKNSATFLLATALIQKSMVDVFDDVYHNKLQINSLHLKGKDVKDQKKIKQKFEKTKKTKWSSDIFSKWVEEKNDVEVNNEIISEYKNTLVDLIAIDRLCSINKQLEKSNKINGKYLFLYYSGAKKSEKIFNLDGVKDNLPTINEYKNYDLLRTLKHSYLLFLIYDKDLDKMKNSLMTLRKIFDQGIKNSYSLKEDKFLKDDQREAFESITKRRREVIEYSSISIQINKHKSFRDKLNEKIKKLRQSPNNYIDIYESFLEEAKKVNESIGHLEIDISYLLQGKLLDLIDLLKNKQDFSINKGSDLIKGAYHHLPILLFFDKNSSLDNPDIENLYFELTDFIVLSSEYKEDKFKSFINSVTQIYYHIEEGIKIRESYDSMLIKVLIYMVVQKPENISEDAYSVLKNTYDLLKTNQYALEKWEDDYIYLLVWLSRRINLHKESNEFCKKGMAKFPNDPRFLHGKTLFLYNKYYSKKSLISCEKTKLIEIINFAERAIEGYNFCCQNPDSYRERYFDYIKGNISALQNLILYCISIFYLELLESEKSIETQIVSKYTISFLRDNLLLEIKKFEDDRSHFSKVWPEYSHTESIFELVEGIYSRDKKKIQLSYKEIENALSRDPNSELYLKTKTKIKSWMVKLSGE